MSATTIFSFDKLSNLSAIFSVKTPTLLDFDIKIFNFFEVLAESRGKNVNEIVRS